MVGRVLLGVLLSLVAGVVALEVHGWILRRYGVDESLAFWTVVVAAAFAFFAVTTDSRKP